MESWTILCRKELCVAAAGLFALLFALVAGTGPFSMPVKALLVTAGTSAYAAAVAVLVLDWKRAAPRSACALEKRLSQIVLLSEAGSMVRAWELLGTALLIGRSEGRMKPGIDLAGSPNAASVRACHAAFNYAGGSWYVEPLDGPVTLRRAGRAHRLGKGPVRLMAGDVLEAGLCRLRAE